MDGEVSSEWFDSDDRLLREVTAALAERDAVPATLLESARAAFTFRTIEDDLEYLTTHPSGDEGDLARSEVEDSP